MMLIPNYFTIVESVKLGNDEYRFVVILDKSCDIYRGHFPDEPISPGVCNIEMILECAGDAIDRELSLKKIERCRLTKVVSPETTPILDISIKLNSTERGVEMRAVLSFNKEECMTLHAIVE